MRLIEYAFLKDFPQKLQNLADMTMKGEGWTSTAAGSEKNNILKSYVDHYFKKVYEEGKVESATLHNETYSFFNTGLLTDWFEEIYGVFSVNKTPNKQPFYLVNFFRYGDDTYRGLWVGKQPKTASFFSKLEDVLFDPSKPIVVNNRHIIEDNMSGINHNGKPTDEIFTIVNGAIEKTKKMIERNYKFAIPQYFRDKNASSGEIQFLIPVYFGEIKKNPDVILAVKKENDYYVATTCLTMDMAYNNARLIAKPSDEWLIP